MYVAKLTARSIALSLVVAACDFDEEPPDVEVECRGDDIEIEVLEQNPERIVRSDLLVRGTAEHSADLTIRNIMVAGVAATRDAFNFRSWTATVPLAVLRSLPPGEGGLVSVPVVATDACEEEARADFLVNLGIPVENLALVRTYPDGEGYIPANGKFHATLVITAAPAAAGARVTFQTSEGGSLGATVANQVVLAGDGTANAVATATFTSTRPGRAWVTATAGDASAAPVEILVADRPSLFPSSSALRPSQAIRVTADTEGRVESCQATPAQGITVTSAGHDLMAGAAAAEDEDGDGRVDIEVKAADTLTGPVSVTVACRDPFGQTASGTYTAAP
ncbi:hypothetical protein [Sorangium sp. So ce426]|uniref:hypothetical protein n=1 Tax=Sorangium sp. So ce426 TaxID=3133312 RepID=UPI003F5C6F71